MWREQFDKIVICTKQMKLSVPGHHPLAQRWLQSSSLQAGTVASLILDSENFLRGKATQEGRSLTQIWIDMG